MTSAHRALRPGTSVLGTVTVARVRVAMASAVIPVESASATVRARSRVHARTPLIAAVFRAVASATRAFVVVTYQMVARVARVTSVVPNHSFATWMPESARIHANEKVTLLRLLGADRQAVEGKRWEKWGQI